jgi:putative GTP pyrophosphokinase
MELPMSFNEEELWGRTLLLYNAALLEIGTKLEILNNEFKQAHQYNPIEHITSRIKSSQSIAKKMRHNGRELTVENIVKYINDIAGIRIICSFTSDIYRIADLIAKQSDITVLKVKDYIVNPKPNGYTSYHMIVSVPIFLSNEVIDTKVEIQIRTIAMDFWASLEHKIYYKFEGHAPDHITRELKECADLVSFLDRKMVAINEEVQNYRAPEQEEGREVYLTNLIKERMKDAYGTVIDEKSAIEEVKESEYPLSYKEESTQKINEETHSISGEEENWRPVEEDGMLKVITEQVIKEKERTPGFLSRFSFRKA